MNKNDLIAAVAERCGMSKADVGRAVDATLDTITEALKKNDNVRLVGFGTLTVAERAASEGRNPRTGQPIRIPASKQPRFKAGKTLREALGPHGAGGGRHGAGGGPHGGGGPRGG